MPSIHEILLQVAGDATGGERALAQIAAELTAFNDVESTAELHVAVDKAIADVAKVRGELEAVAHGKTSIELEVKTNLARAALARLEDQAQRVQHEIAKAVEGGEVDPTALRGLSAALDAMSRQVKGQVGSVVDQFQREVNEKLRFDRVSVDVDTEGLTRATVQIAAYKERLEEIGRRPVTTEIKVQTAKALVDLELVERKIKDVQAEASRSGGRAGGVSSLFGDISAVTRQAEGVERSFAAMGQEAGKSGGLIAQLFGGSAGDAIGSFAGKTRDLQEAFTAVGLIVIAALIPAIIALAGSLAAAISGAAGLATAFLAALGPAVVLLVGLFERFAKILQARKALQQEDNHQVNLQADASKKAAAAEEQRYQAQKRIRDALQGLVTAERAVTQAREEAAKKIAELTDRDAAAQRTVQTAVIELGRASQDVDTARAAAKQKILDLQEKEADAARRLQRATTDARRSEADAVTQLERAQRKLAEAAVKAGDDGVAAAERYARALQDVKDAQFALADAILAVEGANLGVESAQLRVNELLSKTPSLAKDAFAALAKIRDVDFGPDALAGLTQSINQVGGASPSEDANALKRALLELAKAKLQVQQATNKQSEAETDLGRKQAAVATATKASTQDTSAYQTALDAVADAQRRLRDAQIAGARAIADAGRAYKSASHDAREAARTGVDGSAAVQSARRQEADATRRLADAQRAAATADHELNQARAAGLDSTAAVIAANERLRDAEQQVADARHAATVKTVGDFGKLPGQVQASKAALEQLDAAELHFLGTLNTAIDAFKGILRPATDLLFNALGEAFTLITPFVPKLQGLFTGLAGVWASKIKSGAKALVGPAWREALHEIFVQSTHLASPALDALGSILVIIRNLAVALLPDVVKIVTKVADGLGRLADSTSDIDRLRHKFTPLVAAFLQVSDLVGSLIGLFFDFGVAIGPIGDPLVGSINDVVNGLREMLRSQEGLRIIRDFFSDTLPLAKDLGSLVVDIGILLGGLFELAAPGLDALFRAFDRLVKATGRIVIAIRRLIDLDFKGFARAGAGAIAAFFSAFTNPIGLAKGAAFLAALVVTMGGLAGLFFPIGVAVFAAMRAGFVVGGKLAEAAFTATLAAMRVAGAILAPLFAPIGAAIVASLEAGIAAATAGAALVMAALGTVLETAIVLGPFLLIGAAIVGAIVAGVKNWDRIKGAVSAGLHAVMSFFRREVERFGPLGRSIITAIVHGIVAVALAPERAMVRVVGAVVSYLLTAGPRFVAAGGRFIGGIVSGIRAGIGRVTSAGRSLVAGLVGAFEGIGRTIAGVMKPVLNAVIASVNFVLRGVNFLIRAINSIPNVKIPGLGSVGVPTIRQVGLIPQLATGGIATRSTIAEIGEKGHEAILPLTQAVFDDLAASITRSMAHRAWDPSSGGSTLAAASTAAGGAPVEQHFHVKAPAGHLPDVETTVALISKKVRTLPGSFSR